MNIYVQDLVFETTRRCNGGKHYGGKLHPCEHCLRGMPQNVVMTNEVIRAAARSITQAGCLTFSGGEPTLVPCVIEEIFHQFDGKGYEAFYIVTNGVRYSPKTVAILNDVYKNNRYLEAEITALSVSVDQFHEFNSEVYNKYKDLEFFRPDKEYSYKNFETIVDEGLAHENGIGRRNFRPTIEIDFHGDETFDIGMLYINALGDVIPGCDFSYKTQETIKIGNILEETLEAIILRYIVEHGEEDKGVSRKVYERHGSAQALKESAA